MIEKQAPIFRQYLTEQCEKIYKLIFGYCTHANRSLQRVAFPALESFLVQIASEITSGARSLENDKLTFRVRDLWENLRPNLTNACTLPVLPQGVLEWT